MAITYTIQCDGVTTAFTIARAITTKESISLTIASGVSAGTTVSGADFTFSPVNNTAQSVTITWLNAVNYGTVSVPVDVTVAVYHNPGANAADSLLYSYDSASAMRFEMVGRDLEHIIEYLKMVIGGADLATTSLGDQEDAIDALDGRVDAAEATIVTHTSQIAALDTRLDTAESDIVTAQGTADGAVTVNTTQNTRIALLELAAGFVNPLDAADIALADAGTYFPTGNVEAALQAIGAGAISSISGKQPLDSDLTAIAALAPSNDDVLQRKAGAWTNRSLAQLRTDLATGFGASAVNGHFDGAVSSTSSPFDQTCYDRSITVVAGAPEVSTAGVFFTPPFKWVAGMPTKLKITADYNIYGSSDNGGASTIELEARVCAVTNSANTLNAMITANSYSLTGTVLLSDVEGFAFGSLLDLDGTASVTSSAMSFNATDTYVIYFAFNYTCYGNGVVRSRIYGYNAQWVE